MENITNITRDKIRRIIIDGVTVDHCFAGKIVTKINYYGKLEPAEFLERLYPLEDMPSFDSRLQTASQDIKMHTRNGDWSDSFVFEDPRLELNEGSDEILLKFLKEIFHPEVIDENSEWQCILDELNKLLKEDGYEIVPASKISGMDVFDWRTLDKAAAIFLPFSYRNKNNLEILASLKVSEEARLHIASYLELHNTKDEMIDGNYRYYESPAERFFTDIRKFGAFKEISEEGIEYLKNDDISSYIELASTIQILDAIEYFAWSLKDFEFVNELNRIFHLFDVHVTLDNSKITLFDNEQIVCAPEFEEEGLTVLIERASEFFKQGDYSIALEKLWDALERLKTYHVNHELNKKKSIDIVINQMSESNEFVYQLLNAEFIELTRIGNGASIRHFETTVSDISSEKHQRYLYNRCLSLINLASEYLE